MLIIRLIISLVVFCFLITCKDTADEKVMFILNQRDYLNTLVGYSIERSRSNNYIIRFSKDGKIQFKAKKGTAMFQQKGQPVSTTSSTTFVSIAGMSTKHMPKQLLTKQNQNKLKQLYQYLKKNKNFLRKLADKSPVEIEWFVVNIGIIKVRFKPKKKKKKLN